LLCKLLCSVAVREARRRSVRAQAVYKGACGRGQAPQAGVPRLLVAGGVCAECGH